MNLIFETSLSGHRLEYIKHLYQAAANRTNQYLFVLPEQIEQLFPHSDRPTANNITIQTLSKKEIDQLSKGNKLICSIRQSLVLRKYALQYQAEHIFLIFLMNYMPWVLFFLPKKVQVSGIIYRIFLYQESMCLLKKTLNWLLYRIIASSKQIRNAFLLNDHHSANTFNQTLKTTKFTHIPDPITTCDFSHLIDIRKKFNIPPQQLLFAHFGGLTERKGTITILEAITKIPIEKKDLFCFFFAGKVYDDIKEEFYTRIAYLKKKGYHIFSNDSFVSYNFLHSLAEASDAILLPYSNPQQSSGVLGYAALHQKPVIGSKEGLLGKLITYHKLGDTLNDTSSDAIYNAIIKFRRKKIISNYTTLNSIEKFSNIALSYNKL